MVVEIIRGSDVVADLGKTPTYRGALHLIFEWAREHTPRTCDKGYWRGILSDDHDVIDYGDYCYFGRIWK